MTPSVGDLVRVDEGRWRWLGRVVDTDTGCARVEGPSGELSVWVGSDRLEVLERGTRRNADDDLRRSEREARQSGDVASRARSLQWALRAGQIRPEAVEFAARLGDPAAREVSPAADAQLIRGMWTRDELLEAREIVGDQQFVAWVLECFEETQRRRQAAAGDVQLMQQYVRPISPRTGIGRGLTITRLWIAGAGPAPTTEDISRAGRSAGDDFVRQSAHYVVTTAWALADPEMRGRRSGSNDFPAWVNYAFQSLDRERQHGRWKDLFAWQRAALTHRVLAPAETRRNPPIGAPWLTPRLAARLRDLERRLIRNRTRLFGRKHGEFVCGSAPDAALDLVLDHAGQEGCVVQGSVLYPGLRQPYLHSWIALDDGTIVDVASSQFGQRSPLVIPRGHPMQRLYEEFSTQVPRASDDMSGICSSCGLGDHASCEEPDCMCECLDRAMENPTTPFADFARELPSFLASRKALSALDGLPTNNGDSPWLNGGCFVLSEALADFLGPDALAVDITNDGLDSHSVVEVNGDGGPVWIDGRGAFDPARARSLFPGMTGLERHDRMRNRGRVWKLVSALRERFGSVRLPE